MGWARPALTSYGRWKGMVALKIIKWFDYNAWLKVELEQAQLAKALLEEELEERKAKVARLKNALHSRFPTIKVVVSGSPLFVGGGEKPNDDKEFRHRLDEGLTDAGLNAPRSRGWPQE